MSCQRRPLFCRCVRPTPFCCSRTRSRAAGVAARLPAMRTTSLIMAMAPPRADPVAPPPRARLRCAIQCLQSSERPPESPSYLCSLHNPPPRSRRSSGTRHTTRRWTSTATTAWTTASIHTRTHTARACRRPQRRAAVVERGAAARRPSATLLRPAPWTTWAAAATASMRLTSRYPASRRG